MQRLVALALLLLLAAAPAPAPAPNTATRARYTSRFDNVDLDRILTSRRLVANYVDCLLGRKRCPPEGAELKRVLPDALATRCARCSERQREAAVRAIRLLRQRYPDLWAPLQQKWDPTGEHTLCLEQAMARRAAAAKTLLAASHTTPTATLTPAAEETHSVTPAALATASSSDSSGSGTAIPITVASPAGQEGSEGSDAPSK